MSPEPIDLMNELALEFDAKCIERHEVGQDKYGPFSFLGKDMIQEAIYEILDMSNYARYQYIKLRMLQMALAEDPRIKALGDEDGEVNIGIQSFKGTQT